MAALDTRSRTIVASLAPPTFVPRPGVACFRTEEVTSAAEVDAVVAARITLLDSHPLIARVRSLATTVEAVCAAGPSDDCTDAHTARTQALAQITTGRRVRMRQLARAVRTLVQDAEDFKTAKGW